MANQKIEVQGLQIRVEQMDAAEYISLTDIARKNSDDKPANLVSPKNYIEQTGAIGLVSRAGKHGGGTFDHSEIALEFCTWISPPFKVYFFKEFQRLKRADFDRQNLQWHIRKITDNIDEVRNLLDTIPGQASENIRLQLPDDFSK